MLGCLVAVVVIMQIAKNKRGDRSFRSEIITVDSSDISALIIETQVPGEEMKLERIDQTWNVKYKGEQFVADKRKVQELVVLLSLMKPLRVAAIDKSSWRDFDVTDSAGLSVKIESNGKVKQELIIGRFSYKQPDPNDPMAHYNQMNSMSTFVRTDDDERVYLVQGFLRYMFQGDLSVFRNKDLVNTQRSNWNKLTFTYPADSSFVLQKKEGKWFVNDMPADSQKVQNYFNNIENLTSFSFLDKNSAVAPISHKLVIGTADKSIPIDLSAVPTDSTSLLAIRSSINKDGIFSGAGSNLFIRIFISKASLLPSVLVLE